MKKFIEDLVAFLKTQPFNMIRVSVAEGDEETETFDFVPANRCQDTYSCAKAFTMTAIGLLYDEGLLRMEDKVCDIMKAYIPESGMDERWYTVTVDMLLRHRAGLPGGFLDIDCCDMNEFGKDHLEYMFTYPLAYTPGEGNKYSDGAYYLLSRIVEEISGKSTADLLWDKLLFPMKFKEAAFSSCPMGHTVGATGLYVHSEDLIKLGRLYLSGGVYDGKRLLSEEWTKLAVERGYCFDKDPNSGAYFKGGMYGQKLIVIPEQKRVVAVQAYGANTDLITEWAVNYGK